MRVMILKQWTKFRKEFGVRHWLDEERKSDDRLNGYTLLRGQIHDVAGRQADPILLSAIDDNARKMTAAVVIVSLLMGYFAIMATYALATDPVAMSGGGLFLAMMVIGVMGALGFIFVCSIRTLALPRVLARDSYVNDLYRFPTQHHRPDMVEDDEFEDDEDDDDER